MPTEMDAVKRLLARLASDDSFNARLRTDPKSAIGKSGIALSSEQVEALGRMANEIADVRISIQKRVTDDGAASITVTERREPASLAVKPMLKRSSQLPDIRSRVLDGVFKQALIESVRRAVSGAECVIVIPPSADVTKPALGPHILKAVAQSEGLSVRILYANAIFASIVSLPAYEALCNSPRRHLLGERIFSRLAHGTRRLGTGTRALFRDGELRKAAGLTRAAVRELEARTDFFGDVIAAGLADIGCKIVGFSSNFEQTNAAVALMRAIKSRRPSMITLLGGANCEGSMAAGLIGAASDAIDYIFSGECESVFPPVIRGILDGAPPKDPIIHGEACMNMDALPAPDYADYFEQLSLFLPEQNPANCWLMYETSRGCWWGEKRHCTFCGLNGQTMTFREKTPDKVLADLRRLLPAAPTAAVAMTDNIMPHAYHGSLVPKLQEASLPARIFYEQKANLTLDQVRNLKQAGITEIQPGIEALSTPLLRLMDKGVSARQNIALLRYARIFDIVVNWNMLCELPHDLKEHYTDTLEIVPLIAHLNPPTSLSPLSVDRFSPYFDKGERYHITNRRPLASYREAFPEWCDAEAVAYHFEADYPSGSRASPSILKRISEEIGVWRKAWSSGSARPILLVSRLDERIFILADTRSAVKPRIVVIDKEQAAAALIEGDPSCDSSQWAISGGYAALVDGRSVPLAVSSYELLKMFEEDARFRAPRPDQKA